MSPDEKLVYMANQLARNFAVQGEARAVTSTADHLKRFWDPAMRARLFELAKQPNVELMDAVKKALPLLH